MYKIFIKFDTSNPTYNLYDCYMEENEYGDIVEYESSDLSEVENKVKELLKKYTSDRIHIFSTTEIKFDVTVTDDSVTTDTSSDIPTENPTDTPSDNTDIPSEEPTENPEENTETNTSDESGSE